MLLRSSVGVQGPCPNCGAFINSFFGTILTIPSGGTENEVKCEACVH